MDNFLYMSKKARILDSMPEIASNSVDKLNNYPFIREFGCQKFDTVVPRSLNPHYNKGIEVCYIVSGKFRWKVEDKEYLLFPGDCFVTCPYERHGGVDGFLDLGTLFWIIIEPEKFDKNSCFMLGDWSGIPAYEQKKLGEILQNKTWHKFKNEGIKTIFLHLFNEIKNQDCFSDFIIKKLSVSLLIETCRSIIAVNEDNNYTDGFVDVLNRYILNNIHNNITLHELSRYFKVSESSLNKKIKRLTGYTPINYVINQRLEQAKYLMMVTGKTITSIAHDCGFYSSQYFSDTFKKWHGISPGEYRKNSINEP